MIHTEVPLVVLKFFKRGFIQDIQTYVQDDGKNTETQSCGRKGRVSSADTDIDVLRNESKVPRFELDVPNDNVRNLPTDLADYLLKYVHLPVSDRDTREKILKDNCVPCNIRESQVLDNKSFCLEIKGH